MYAVEPPQEPSGEVVRGSSGEDRSRGGRLGSFRARAMAAGPRVGNARSARRMFGRWKSLFFLVCYCCRWKRSSDYKKRWNDYKSRDVSVIYIQLRLVIDLDLVVSIYCCAKKRGRRGKYAAC